MSLVRRRTVKQFKELRRIIKKAGGDIGDKTVGKSVANQIYINNVFDEKNNKINTIEDHMSIPENVIKFKDFNPVNEKKEVDTGLLSPKEIQREIKGINNWHSDFKHTVPMRQNSIAGKSIQIGDVSGFIKRIVDGKIVIESGMEELEFPLKNIFKNYKIEKENKEQFAISFKNPNEEVQEIKKFDNFKL
jgi:hypothetical protein